MSESPLLVAGAFELSDKRVGLLMAEHRYVFPGWSLRSRLRGLPGGRNRVTR
jgi:hypothetical protein